MIKLRNGLVVGISALATAATAFVLFGLAFVSPATHHHATPRPAALICHAPVRLPNGQYSSYHETTVNVLKAGQTVVMDDGDRWTCEPNGKVAVH
jgi:hypothetical protein